MIWRWPSREYTENMSVIQFSEYQDEILEEINKLTAKNYFRGDKNLTLIEGFVSQTITTTFGMASDEINQTIPMVMLVGLQTGRVYYLALKVLIPRINLK
jgi:hypothetical protein